MHSLHLRTHTCAHFAPVDGTRRRLVNVYMRDVFRDDILTEPMAPLTPELSSYYIPEDGTLDSYKK